MKYRPFLSYLGRPLNLVTGEAWYKEDITHAERQFVKQFDTHEKIEQPNQEELWEDVLRQHEDWHEKDDDRTYSQFVDDISKSYHLIKKQ